MSCQILIQIVGWMLCCCLAQAESLFDRRLSDGRFIFDVLVEAGVPEIPLELIFKMLDFNENRIPNTDYAVFVDYSQRSTEKRFYLLNLRTAEVERFFVSHGIGSGVLEARAFSNKVDSWRSSLGFFFAKGTYMSDKNGLSLRLQGIDNSNKNAGNRGIVLHGANYVSESFIRRYGRLGLSEGCFAVELRFTNRIVSVLKGGGLIFSYHKDLMVYSRKYPLQQLLPGEEAVPSGVQRRRAPGEGGDARVRQLEPIQ